VTTLRDIILNWVIRKKRLWPFKWPRFLPKSRSLNFWRIWSVKFHWDLISSFWVILLTDRQIDRQTDRLRWKHNLLGAYSNCSPPSTLLGGLYRSTTPTPDETRLAFRVTVTDDECVCWPKTIWKCVRHHSVMKTIFLQALPMDRYTDDVTVRPSTSVCPVQAHQFRTEPRMNFKFGENIPLRPPDIPVLGRKIKGQGHTVPPKFASATQFYWLLTINLQRRCQQWGFNSVTGIFPTQNP